MKRKAIAASTHIDRHNTKISLEALESAADQINNGTEVPIIGLDHDITIPPLGKCIEAYTELLPDGEHQAVIVQDYFDGSGQIEMPDGSILIKEYSLSDNRPLATRGTESVEKTHLAYDFVNFDSKESLAEFLSEVRSEGEFEEEVEARKALIPDPQLILVLKAAFVGYLSSKLLPKVGDKTAEEVSKDIADLYKFFKVAVSSYAKYAIPKYRPITYVFEMPWEVVPLEFVIRTSDPDTAVQAILIDKIVPCMDKAIQLTNTLGAVKVQFIYEEDNEWHFNYLFTSDGTVIGTPKSYDKRAKKFELMCSIQTNSNNGV